MKTLEPVYLLRLCDKVITAIVSGWMDYQLLEVSELPVCDLPSLLYQL